MKKRIYVIWDRGEAVALVRSHSQASAIAHVVGDRFEAVVADQDHLVRFAPTMKVIETGEDGDAEAKAAAEAAAKEAALRG